MNSSVDGKITQSIYLGLNVDQSNEPDLMILALVVVATFTLGAVTYAVNSKAAARKLFQLRLNPKTEQIISPLFDNKPLLVYLFAGQTLISDKHLPNEIKTEIPTEILDQKNLIHPVRLSIVKLLYDNTKITTSELRSALGLSTGELNHHLNMLKKSKHVFGEHRFVEDRVQNVFQLEPSAIEEYKKLKNLLIEFLDIAPNLDRYLNEALKIENRKLEEDLYPSGN